MQDYIQKKFGSPEAIGIIDETGMPKKGTHTVGVQQQYCGASGKLDNCVVSVHLGLATDSFSTLVDSDLFLPESWCTPEQKKKAGIPADVTYRSKLLIAIELLDRSLQTGLQLKYMTADAFYGRSREFRRALAERGLLYVVQIPTSITGWKELPALEQGPRCGLKLSENQPAAQAVSALIEPHSPDWAQFYVKETEKGPLVVEAQLFSIWASESSLPGEEERLLVVRNPLDNEYKYFLSNAEPDVPIETLLKVAFVRSEVEHLFQVAKGEIGLDHFEVRSYLAVQRHLAISMLSLLFFMQEFSKLQKKRLLEPSADSQRDRGAA